MANGDLGSTPFLIQAIAAGVLSVLAIILGSKSKVEIRISGARGKSIAYLAFVIGLLGLAYCAINLFNAYMLSGAFDIETTPTQLGY